MSVLELISENTNWLTVLLAALVCLTTYVYIRWSRRPPGPIGLPYLGYYPFLSEEDYYLQLWEMSKKYGKVYCFGVTGQLYAHIADMKTVREVALTKSDSFEKRPESFTMLHDIFNNGIFTLKGEEWKVMRKFFIQQFRELGMGKKAQEGVMDDCLKNIVSTFKDNQNKDFNASELFINMANVVILEMMFAGAKRDEKDVENFSTAYFKALHFASGLKILLAGPLLEYVIMNLSPKYRRYRENKATVVSLMTKFAREREKEFDPNNLENLVDFYVNERKHLEQRKDPKSKYFTEHCLVASLIQFIGDGSLGIGWLVSAILKAVASRPDIQKTIQAEIDEVVGRNRFPSWDDRSRLAYTNATIHEVLRTTKFFPLIPSLECTKEITLEGCRIPKGTIALFNFWAVFHDPRVYDEPYKFDPTRFISVDGKKPRCEIPALFGVGKRSCAGESLSTMEILLYVTTVLQNFDIRPTEKPGKEAEDWNMSVRATLRAH